MSFALHLDLLLHWGGEDTLQRFVGPRNGASEGIPEVRQYISRSATGTPVGAVEACAISGRPPSPH